ncbi:MAG: hypothetical protein DRP00_05885, partial [Candidatus Aenigmatarchaeota archaeon]
PYIYSTLEPPSIELSDLPQGFDLIINGHIHTRQLKKLNDGYFLIPGSTVVTQLKKEEAETPKGFYKVIIERRKLKDIKFIELENVRKFFLREIEIGETDIVREKVNKVIEDILQRDLVKPPIVRIKLKGRGEVLEKEIREIEKRFEGRALVRIFKETEDEEIKAKMEILQKLKERKMSIEDLGISILKENLKTLKFEYTLDPRYLLSLLSEEDVDKIINILLAEQKTFLPLLKKSVERIEEKGEERGLEEETLEKQEVRTPSTGWDRWIKK